MVAIDFRESLPPLQEGAWKVVCSPSRPEGTRLTHPLRGLRHLRAYTLRQGRYKSLIVEEDSHLGALLHYVHLNPVRAGMVTVEQLKEYRWSSYWYLFNKRARPAFLDCSGALEAAGGLADTPKGRQQYMNYLKWLSTDDTAQKEMSFDKMCRGWALGTKAFKKALLEEVEQDQEPDESEVVPRYDGGNLREANELRWEMLLDKGLAALGQDANSILNEPKSA